MSRIGKKSISIPDGVELKTENKKVIIKGPKGQLEQILPDNFELIQDKENKELSIKPIKESKSNSALGGLFRSLIFNMIKGVTDGFEKKLEINGVSYRASVQNNNLILNLGLSHPVEIEAPKDISFEVEKNIITVLGIDKQLVGQIAAKVREQKKPEPYKGKGIKYIDEVIRRKSGKKSAGTE
ncbi:MAG: 50S ribosomal protein L6 [Patescibacteria group bacterium]|nr:50S ribosomal protein L6 [Patescibacteria group bacterium]